jgi:formylglycine-generating enzyme required for sulfatase activity
MLTYLRIFITLLPNTVVVLLCACVNVFAQVSNVEGLKPLEGATIPQAQINKAIKPGATFKDCNECPEMVVIPAGRFLMGSAEGGEDNEKPQHFVQIQSFALGKYEITQEGWVAVIGTNPSFFKGRKLPVENISWDDAQKFIELLSQKTGKKYRLPSEAEWEYAARGGSLTKYHWGDDDSELGKYVWGKFKDRTNTVGMLSPNQFGLYDMIGNVSEWTEDCWNANYNDAPLNGTAWRDGYCKRRMVRGGAWLFGPEVMRPAFRRWERAVARSSHIGIRVARSN